MRSHIRDTSRLRSSRGRRVVASGAALALLLTACGSDDGGDDATATDDTAAAEESGDDGEAATDDGEAAADDGGSGELQDVSFRFNIHAYGLHAPFVYAQEMGFYEEEGLNVSFGEGQGSETTGALVADGSDDFGLVDLPGITSLVDQDAPVQSVAIVEQRSPLAIISLADSGIEEPEDLHGTTIVMEGGDLESFESFVEVAGLDIDQIETLTMADTAQAAALESGRVDGVFGWVTSQGSETIELSGGITELLFADYDYDLLNTTLVAGTSMIEEDPDLVCRFVRASFRGWEAAQEDPQGAVDALIGQFQNVNPNIALYGLEQQFGLLQADETEGEELGFVTMDMVDSSLEVLREVGAVTADLSAEAVYNPMCFEG
jgi:NitT/TauT family transport system substrate-binding protein